MSPNILLHAHFAFFGIKVKHLHVHIMMRRFLPVISGSFLCVEQSQQVDDEWNFYFLLNKMGKKTQ